MVLVCVFGIEDSSVDSWWRKTLILGSLCLWTLLTLSSSEASPFIWSWCIGLFKFYSRHFVFGSSGDLIGWVRSISSPIIPSDPFHSWWFTHLSLIHSSSFNHGVHVIHFHCQDLDLCLVHWLVSQIFSSIAFMIISIHSNTSLQSYHILLIININVHWKGYIDWPIWL